MGVLTLSQDPLYGNIEIIFPEIDRLLRTYDILRLKHIRQANLTSLVFPGATHTRFSHSLGSMYLAQETFDYLMTLPDSREIFSENEWNGFKNLVMLFLLIHDASHPPFSHVIEYATKHYRPKEDPLIEDEDDFVAFETIGAPLEWEKINHENILVHLLSMDTDVKKLRDYYQTWLTDWYPEFTLKEFFLSKEKELSDLLKLNEIGINNICEDIINISRNEGDIIKKHPFIRTLTDSYIDLDRIDHLSRDAYGSGIKAAILNYYLTIHNFRILCREGKSRLAITKDGIAPILHMLTAREILYEAFYSHPMVRAYEAEFQRALIKLLANTNLDIDHVLLSIDYFAFKNMLDFSKEEKDGYSQNMLNRVLSQQPHKLYIEYRYKRSTFGVLRPSEITINRLEVVEEEIAKKLHIGKEDIIIYIEWTGNMEELVRLSFGEKIDIMIYDSKEENTIEDYHPWIKQVLIDWTNRASCRVYIDDKIPHSSHTTKVIEETLIDHGIIGE